MEEIERQECDGPSRASLEPCRHRGRIRAPRRIDDHELAVQHRRAGIDPDGQPGQLPQLAGEVGAILVHDADNPAAGQLGRAHVHEGSPAAPPRLEQVLIRIEWLGEGSRQHRPEVGQARQDRLLGLEPERELVGHRRSMVAGHAPGPAASLPPTTRPDPALSRHLPSDVSAAHPDRATVASPAQRRARRLEAPCTDSNARRAGARRLPDRRIPGGSARTSPAKEPTELLRLHDAGIIRLMDIMIPARAGTGR